MSNLENDACLGAGPRARRRGGRLHVITLTFGLGALAGALALGGCSAASSSTSAAYGSLPTYLPTNAIEPDSVLTGTATDPALTTEGDSVKAQMAGASVMVTVTGPDVPGEGLPYQDPATTCTWTVTMTGASSKVPITVGDFTTIDHLGAVYHPTLVAGQPVPPATLAPGQTVTFELRAVMIVGEGLMRWAPGGQKILASWDFEVEND